MALTTLPAPTTDRERARDDLDRHGYCLIAGALGQDEVTALRASVVDLADLAMRSGRAYTDGGGANQRIWQLLNRGDAFADLAIHPTALEMIGHLLGGHPQFGVDDGLPQFLLSSITANIAGPGGDAMQLHADQVFLPHPWPPFPVVANVLWMLDDFTDENGATRILPGTHLTETPPAADAAAETVAAEAPAGTAMVFEGRLWHGTGRNVTTDQRRHAILAYYCKPWIRQQENSTVSVRRDVLANASPALRRLLGFDLYASLGMIDGLQNEADMLPEALRTAR